MNVRLIKNQTITTGSPEDIYSIMQQVLLRESRIAREKEHFWVIGLTTSDTISYIERVSLGSISATIINPLEVFNLAVRKKSPKIILVHNHPGGNLGPSTADKDITNNIIEGGKTLTIEVLDHLVISAESYYSFAENGLL